MVETKLAIALLNLCLSVSISAVIFCRINALPSGISFWRAAPYAFALTGGLAWGLQPWFGRWPGYVEVAISVLVLLYLLSKRSHRC